MQVCLLFKWTNVYSTLRSTIVCLLACVCSFFPERMMLTSWGHCAWWVNTREKAGMEEMGHISQPLIPQANKPPSPPSPSPTSLDRVQTHTQVPSPSSSWEPPGVWLFPWRTLLVIPLLTRLPLGAPETAISPMWQLYCQEAEAPILYLFLSPRITNLFH